METYYHSVVLDEDKCIGCTNCIKRCPTQAIRVKDGKAVIIKERCIDCGECIRVCPQNAKKSITDPLEKTNEYKYRIALVAPTLMGQFDDEISPGKIVSALKLSGFDDVFEVARGADISTKLTKEIMEDKKERPLISSSCPAIVRLIQARFPDLIDHLMPLLSPMEISAYLARERAMENFPEYSKDDIGVFFLSPCPAKVSAVINHEGMDETNVDGVISIGNVVPLIIENLDDASDDEGVYASSTGIGWARPNGEVIALGIRNYLSVDGIEEAISILDSIENGKLDHVDFIEITACPNGCVGGPLNVENKYISRRRIRYLSETYPSKLKTVKVPGSKTNFVLKHKLKSNNIQQLGKTTIESLRIMKQIEELYELLPDDIDCGACGAPSCHALAEDIAVGRSTLDDCIILLRDKLQQHLPKLDTDKE